MNDAENAPTRLARAIAYYVDGGFALVFCVQGLSLTIWLREADRDMLTEYADLLLTGQARFFAVLAAATLLVELLEGRGASRRAGSFGFALNGLELVGDAPRRLLRRLPRVLPFVIGAFTTAFIYLTSEDSMPLAQQLDFAVLVMAGATVVTFAFAFMDAALVVYDPRRVTFSDAIAGSRVVCPEPSNASLTNALSTTSTFWWTSALLLGLAHLEASRDEEVFATELLVAPANASWLLAALATGATSALVFTAMQKTLGRSAARPFTVFIVTSIPVVSFFAARGFVRDLLEALDVPHERAMRVRAAVEFGFLGRSVASLVLLHDAADLASGTSSAPVVGAVLEGAGVSLGGAAVYLHAASAVVLGLAFRALAALDYRAVLTTPDGRDVAEVFA